MSSTRFWICTATCALLAATWIGCSSSKSGVVQTADSAWIEARGKFLDGEYLEAERLLDIMKLQYSGSAHSDSVQFLLGECNYKEGKYLLAAYEFSALRRSYPNSPLRRLAQLRVAESYYTLAPPSEIDQEYSTKAIDEYQAFLEQYGHSVASDSLIDVATARIHELRSRMAKKCFDTAVLYFKMNQFHACNEYCDIVQEKYYDSDYADRAQLLKIRGLIEMKHFGEANHEIEKFLSTYRASPLVPEARSLRDGIANKVVSQKP